MIHIHDVAKLYVSVVERRDTGVFHAYDGNLYSATEIIESVKEVYRSKGLPTSTAHDYIDRLLQASVITTNARWVSACWNPEYLTFADHAEQAFEQLEGNNS